MRDDEAIDLDGDVTAGPDDTGEWLHAQPVTLPEPEAASLPRFVEIPAAPWIDRVPYQSDPLDCDAADLAPSSDSLYRFALLFFIAAALLVAAAMFGRTG